MRLVFDDEALAEIEDTRRFYNDISAELALRFLNEVQRGLNKISGSPLTWPPYSLNTRRFILRTFPYHLIYRVADDKIVIVAISHAKRDPNYWLDRLKDRR